MKAGVYYDATARDGDPGWLDEGAACEFDEDSDSDDEDFGEKHRQRVQKDGGWLKYMMEYTIFWPYIWPARNAKYQLFFWIMASNTLVTRALNVLYPRQFGIIVDKLYKGANTGVVPWSDLLLWTLYGILASDSCGLPALNEIMENRISSWSHLQLSIAAFDHLMGLPMSFHDSKDSGEVIKAVEQASSLNSLLRTLFLDTTPVILDLIIAFWYVTYLLDAYATTIVLFVGVAYIFVTYYITITMKKARRASARTGRAESRMLYENVSNWATISYFNRRYYEQDRLGKTVNESVKASKWDEDVSIYLFAAQYLCEHLGLLMVSILAAYRVTAGVIPVGNFVTLEAYWDTITTPLWLLGHSYRQLSSDLVDSERLLQLFKRTSNIRDGPFVLPASLAGKIEFSDVGFGYHPDQNNLADFSFVAHPGQTVALVGESGSGKSTALKLLMRFYDVDSGNIKVDDQDIRGVTLHSLREIFGFVPQTNALFNMSVMENVRYGRLDATDEDVFEACKAASIHDKILSFPDGYNTKVGERGVKLSGGEIQRVAIARVILKSPQIVLLDEATSALDSHTERDIQDALRTLTAGRTTIAIAHRLSTITRADLILVIDRGRIVERGTHTELLAVGGRYADYWARQTKSAPSGDSSIA